MAEAQGAKHHLTIAETSDVEDPIFLAQLRHSEECILGAKFSKFVSR